MSLNSPFWNAVACSVMYRTLPPLTDSNWEIVGWCYQGICRVKVFRQMWGLSVKKMTAGAPYKWLPVHHTNVPVCCWHVSEASDINTLVNTASVMKHISTVGLLREPIFPNLQIVFGSTKCQSVEWLHCGLDYWGSISGGVGGRCPPFPPSPGQLWHTQSPLPWLSAGKGGWSVKVRSPPYTICARF
jgi:hypothetical protein